MTIVQRNRRSAIIFALLYNFCSSSTGMFRTKMPSTPPKPIHYSPPLLYFPSLLKRKIIQPAYLYSDVPSPTRISHHLITSHRID